MISPFLCLIMSLLMVIYVYSQCVKDRLFNTRFFIVNSIALITNAGRNFLIHLVLYSKFLIVIISSFCVPNWVQLGGIIE